MFNLTFLWKCHDIIGHHTIIAAKSRKQSKYGARLSILGQRANYVLFIIAIIARIITNF